MSVYAKRAGRKFRELLAEIAEEHKERLSLLDEIDVARACAADAMDALAAIEERADLADVVRQALRGEARAAIQESLKHVAEIVKAASAVETARKHAFGPADVARIISEVETIVHDVVPDGYREEVIRRLQDVRMAAPRVTIEIR